MTDDLQTVKDMIREIRADIRDLNAKVDKAADFQTAFSGFVKVLTAIVILGAGLATIYVAFHNGGGAK